MNSVAKIYVTRQASEDFKNRLLRCLDDLYRYALSISHDPVIAKDLVSETVLKALENKSGNLWIGT